MLTRVNTPERAARYAAKWNTIIAAGQLLAAGVFGNVGFAGESAHNFADGLSFDAKARALTSERQKALRLRKFAASVLVAGGLVSGAAGTYQLASGEHENTSVAALSTAFGGAVLNTVIARRTHKSEQASGNGICADGAHNDGKIHTLLDAATGWIYATGLVAEQEAPGAASISVILNGVLSLGAGLVTIDQILHDQTSE